jgi:multiple antibiotic resistance protein
MCFVLLITLVLMLAASWVQRLIGNKGATIISRIMGMILASLAAASVLTGIKEYFVL